MFQTDAYLTGSLGCSIFRNENRVRMLVYDLNECSFDIISSGILGICVCAFLMKKAREEGYLLVNK